VERFTRVVLGYHGCLESFAGRILSGELALDDWPRSRNQWDWLGHGIYFWEHAPERARAWAQAKARRTGNSDRGAVVGALIQLGDCFDLTDVENTGTLQRAHDGLAAMYRQLGKRLPRNLGAGPDYKRRELDCLVVNFCLETGGAYGSVRAAFVEGAPLYPGAMLHSETHIQIAVRDGRCILGVFRPNL
jgi:hypothetical protein